MCYADGTLSIEKHSCWNDKFDAGAQCGQALTRIDPYESVKNLSRSRSLITLKWVNWIRLNSIYHLQCLVRQYETHSYDSGVELEHQERIPSGD